MKFFKQWFAQREFNKKRQRVITQCQNLYYNIPSFYLAKQAREQQQQFSYEYIYGEIDFNSFTQLLMRCNIQPDSIFYDLGSGAGKAVVCAALLYDFKKAAGIENLQLLHDCASQISQSIMDRNIVWHHTDLLAFPWQDADIIFINAGAFIGDVWLKLLTRLQQLKSGVRIIIVTKLLPTTHFSLIYQDFLPMSWGLARVGIYVVK